MTPCPIVRVRSKVSPTPAQFRQHGLHESAKHVTVYANRDKLRDERRADYVVAVVNRSMQCCSLGFANSDEATFRSLSAQRSDYFINNRIRLCGHLLIVSILNRMSNKNPFCVFHTQRLGLGLGGFYKLR